MRDTGTCSTHTHTHTHTLTSLYWVCVGVWVCCTCSCGMCACVCVCGANNVWYKVEMSVKSIVVIQNPHIHTHIMIWHICTYTHTHTHTYHMPLDVLGIRPVLSSWRHLGLSECPECLRWSLWADPGEVGQQGTVVSLELYPAHKRRGCGS